MRATGSGGSKVESVWQVIAGHPSNGSRKKRGTVGQEGSGP